MWKCCLVRLKLKAVLWIRIRLSVINSPPGSGSVTNSGSLSLLIIKNLKAQKVQNIILFNDIPGYPSTLIIRQHIFFKGPEQFPGRIRIRQDPYLIGLMDPDPDPVNREYGSASKKIFADPQHWFKDILNLYSHLNYKVCVKSVIKFCSLYLLTWTHTRLWT